VSGLTAKCACGAVTITVPRRPDYINDCNCSLCTKLGTTWVYYSPEEVIVDETGLDSFVRADLAEPYLRTFRCASCGCVTHWRLIRPYEPQRAGVNAQLFEPGELDGIETRPVDGRSW
jgi:hypothetical protein